MYHRRKADGLLASGFAFDDSDGFKGLKGLKGVEGAADGVVYVIDGREVFSQLR